MLSLRYLARSLPRAAARVTQPIAPRTPSLLASRYQPGFKAFSTSIWRREPAGESDQVLSAKLGQECELEVGADRTQRAELRTSIEDFRANSPFKIEDKTGTHNVVMTREFGNETVRIEFSVADMNDMEEDYDALEDDGAFADEDLHTDTSSAGKRTINQSGVKGGKIDVAPEDSIAPSDQEEGYDEASLDSQFPLHLGITVTKPGKGAIVIQAQAQNGAIDIAQLSYYPKAELVEPKTPEDVHEAESIYTGPPYSNLDPELQAMILQYLEERGINAELAEFLPQYVDYKEQREYVGMLQNLKQFVDA